MAKTKTSYFCTECGHETSGWLGKCPGCGAWNTMREELKTEKNSKNNSRGSWISDGSENNETIEKRLKSVEDIDTIDTLRVPTGLSELDRVLGGGLVKGSLVLIGGDPGTGKSTLLLQTAGLSPKNSKTLYISGEESLQQIRMRSDRLGAGNPGIRLLAATEFSSIAEAISKLKPDLTIIDSIQTMYADTVSAAPGSVSQVREVTAGLLRIAKQLQTTIVLVGHVTKDGSIAGPRVLEHMVDTVLYFEGENLQNYRMLRAVKNRFGATDELGVFEMTEKGLLSVENASMAMLAGRPIKVAGSVITACLEGTRPLLMEIQALVNETSNNFPLRMAQGYDRNRLNMLLAVAEKYLKIGFQNFDAYINVIGGLKISETAADLAMLSAVLSSVNDKAVPDRILICGEIGLTGEIRSITQADKRTMEASRMGFSGIILPSGNKRQLENTSLPDDFKIYYVDNLKEAFDIIFA